MQKTYHHVAGMVKKGKDFENFYATIATVAVTENKIWAGLSIVGKGDRFCRKTGRELAEKRAIDAVKATTMFVGELPKNLPPMTAFFGSVEDFKLFIQVIRSHSGGIDVLKRRFKVR